MFPAFFGNGRYYFISSENQEVIYAINCSVPIIYEIDSVKWKLSTMHTFEYPGSTNMMKVNQEKGCKNPDKVYLLWQDALY